VSRPKNATELWEYAHRLFGISDWVESPVVGADPFWKYRQAEAGKLKRSLAARKIAIADVVLALDWAKAHGKDIRNVTWAYQYINQAIRWDRERREGEAGKALQERLDAALSVCLDLGDPDSLEWHERLVRASVENRLEVIEAWELEHVELGA
jgi:hypothetical protein